MRISSIDLFLRRDWGVGFGPAVEAVALAVFAASAAIVGAVVWAAPCVVEADILAGGAMPNKGLAAEEAGVVEEVAAAEVLGAVGASKPLPLSPCPGVANKLEADFIANTGADVDADDEAAAVVLPPKVNGLAAGALAPAAVVEDD